MLIKRTTFLNYQKYRGYINFARFKLQKHVTLPKEILLTLGTSNQQHITGSSTTQNSPFFTPSQNSPRAHHPHPPQWATLLCIINLNSFFHFQRTRNRRWASVAVGAARSSRTYRRRFAELYASEKRGRSKPTSLCVRLTSSGLSKLIGVCVSSIVDLQFVLCARHLLKHTIHKQPHGVH